jgi:disulfide bond formation protein DsbB
MFEAGASGVPRSWVLRLALGVGALAGATAGVMMAGTRVWQPWVFLIAPDVAVIAGIGRGLKPGQLHPRAVKLYNALHSFAAPTALAVASFWLASAWLGAAFAWMAHVCFDRAVGFGLRDNAGYIARP